MRIPELMPDDNIGQRVRFLNKMSCAYCHENYVVHVSKVGILELPVNFTSHI